MPPKSESESQFLTAHINVFALNIISLVSKLFQCVVVFVCCPLDMTVVLRCFKFQDNVTLLERINGTKTVPFIDLLGSILNTVKEHWGSLDPTLRTTEI